MTALARLPIRTIIRAIADASRRWRDGAFPPRLRTANRIVERIGYARESVEYALDALFGEITHDALTDTIASELGNLDLLDTGAAGTPTHSVRAFPVGRVAILSSRSTIGVALIPAVFALCAKCDLTVKDREDALVEAFFATLSEEHEAFAQAAHAHAWDAGHHALHNYDAVVAFGSDASLAAIRSACAPTARFVGHASKASLGYVVSNTLTDAHELDELARGAARDLVLYETEGCLSLHLLFVESDDAAILHRIAVALAHALDEATTQFPPGRMESATGAKLAQLRHLALFRAAAGRGSVYTDARNTALLLLDPPDEEPPPFLPRVLCIRRVGTADDALRYLRRHEITIEAFAVAGITDEIRELAAASGAARICRFGMLQRPPLHTPHGGRPRLLDFLHLQSEVS